MYNNSILQNLQTCLPALSKISESFFADPSTMTEMILAVRDNAITFALGVIGGLLDEMDEAIRETPSRKRKWNVVRRDSATLLTGIGLVSYHKTLFKNKINGENCYLLDKLVGKDPHERMTPDALAKLYEEAATSSYQRSGERISLMDSVTKQTVKNKLHELVFPQDTQEPAEKKQVKNLYIDADEDHVSLQFTEKKGDLESGENGYKKNGCMAKLVYVYEGKGTEAGSAERKKLVGTYYHSGVYEGKTQNGALWEEVNQYIEKHYEIAEDGHIFINGDGGAWINRSADVLGAKSVMVLDRFHLQKYMNKATGHMGDSVEDARDELQKAIAQPDRKRVKALFKTLLDFAEEEATKKKVKTCENYILGNWKRIEAGKEYAAELCGCSAEGHVSHVLSDRLSSRPLGWSKKGADKMSRLRAYKFNKGNMLELAMAQKQVKALNGAAREEIYSAAEIMASEKEAKKAVEKYYEVFSRSLAGSQLRKMASITLHVCNL